MNDDDIDSIKELCQIILTTFILYATLALLFGFFIGTAIFTAITVYRWLGG